MPPNHVPSVSLAVAPLIFLGAAQLSSLAPAHDLLAVAWTSVQFYKDMIDGVQAGNPQAWKHLGILIGGLIGLYVLYRLFLYRPK